VTDGWFFGILPDLNTSNPRLRQYAIQQSLWWTILFEADGIRLDTYPLVERSFWREWWQRLQAVRPGMHVVGEAWTTDPAELCFFQGGRTGWDGIDPGVDMVFDFPLNLAIQKVFAGKAPASAIAKALGRDGLYPRPDLLVTFLDNHDTPRLATLPGVNPARQRLAAAFLLTTRGIPQLTWGDELGLSGHMDDRRDFPGGFPKDPRDAFDPANQTVDERSSFDTMRTLLHLRREHPALRLGSLTDLIATDLSYLYLRAHEKERLLIALNLGDKPSTVETPPAALLIPASGGFPRLYGAGTVTRTASGLAVALPPVSCGVFQVSP
jgi:glycosidase